MTVQDIERQGGGGFISRLDAVKEWIQTEQQHRGGRSAIITFAHEARLQLPFTENVTLIADTVS